MRKYRIQKARFTDREIDAQSLKIRKRKSQGDAIHGNPDLDFELSSDQPNDTPDETKSTEEAKQEFDSKSDADDELRESRAILRRVVGTNSEVDCDIVSDFGNITATGQEVNWHNIKLDSVLFITLTTHELQRTGSDEVIAPFTKINDGKMYILGFKETSKFEALKLFTKIDKNATHVDLNAFFNFPLTQINFEPSSDIVYNIDGEIYDSDAITVTVLPGYINFLGSVAD